MTLNLSFAHGAKVLITGATGYTGQVLTRKLCELGCEVRAIARSSSNVSKLNDLPIKWFRGNVYDPLVINQAVSDVEYIFHVAAAYREANISNDTYYKVHVESTKILASAVLHSPSFKRFVHVSTVGVHGHIDNPPANEEYRFNPGDIYQRTKAAAELWIRDFATESGLSLTVIRPAAIYGPADKRLLKLFRMSKRRFFPLFGSGQGLYHLIHVDDLTDIFITAALHPGAVGEVFIAGDPEPRSLVEIATTVADADFCELVCKPFKIDPPLHRRRVAFFTKDRAFDTKKLREVLGYKYTHSSAEGLRATAKWYQAANWI